MDWGVELSGYAVELGEGLNGVVIAEGEEGAGSF